MRTSASILSLRHQARRFAHDRRGGAAIEFVIILPVMVFLAAGAAELSSAFALDRKLTITARAVSDIVAQDTAISDAEMANVLNAGKALLQPFPDSDLKIRVSAVNIDATKKATIAWSDASPAGEARQKDDVVTIPPALLIPNTQLIWGEVAYDFKPSPFAIKSLWPFTYAKNQFFARPREASGQVCRPTCT